MTETERIAHRVYDRYAASELHQCAVIGCTNQCAGSRYCARCTEELEAEPYSLANILLPWLGFRTVSIVCGIILFVWMLAVIHGCQ